MDTYEVIVFDGARWFRGPVLYPSRHEAERATRAIHCAPVEVARTSDIEQRGLPPPPPNMC